MAETSLRITVDLSRFDVAAAKLAKVDARRPLLAWQRDYAYRQSQAPRPSINSAGTFRGNAWAPMKPQYIRKTDGVVVPPQGGVPRATLRTRAGATFQRLGVVTRAGDASIRLVGRSGLTRAEKRAGYGVVRVGQVLSGANVKGKLKRDGSRYTASDLLWGKMRRTGIAGEFLFARPRFPSRTVMVMQPEGRVARAFARLNALRPFMWGPQIQREELPDLGKKVSAAIAEAVR